MSIWHFSTINSNYKNGNSIHHLEETAPTVTETPCHQLQLMFYFVSRKSKTFVFSRISKCMKLLQASFFSFPLILTLHIEGIGHALESCLGWQQMSQREVR